MALIFCAVVKQGNEKLAALTFLRGQAAESCWEIRKKSEVLFAKVDALFFEQLHSVLVSGTIGYGARWKDGPVTV